MATVKVRGLTKTLTALTQAGVDVQDLKGGFHEIGNKVVARAEPLAPERSGALKESIRASKARNKITVRAGGAKAFWAPWVVYGSVHNKPANNFIVSALKGMPIEQLVSRAVTDAMRRAGL
jgi:hypothetical protein